MRCGALTATMLIAVYINRIVWAVYVYGYARGIRCMTADPASFPMKVFTTLAQKSIIPANDAVYIQKVVDLCSQQPVRRGAGSKRSTAEAL